MLVAERAARIEAEAKVRSAEAKAHARALEIAKLNFAIAKLRHQRFGQSAERGALIEQLELQLADLEETAAEAETAAKTAAEAETAAKTAAEAETAAKIAAPANADKVQVHGFERTKPARRPLPDHLPRERIVYPARASGEKSQA